MRTTRLVPLTLLALGACAQTESPQQMATRMAAEAAAARPMIEATGAQWSGYVAAGQADSLAALYTTNARLMGSGTPTAVGRAAIAQNFGGMMQLGAWTVMLHTDSVWANGSLVVETGTWMSTFKPGPHAPPMDTEDHGKYMVRWAQENGRWLMADDIWNSDKMPAPPPARRR